MKFYPNNPPRDCFAAECDDQIPVISTMGRGLKGDAYKVEVSDPDTDNETHLEGFRQDSATGAWTSEWLSENINGGKLEYQYNLRPGTDPRTFTITFKYTRPGRPEWCWTTPAIPYIWQVTDDGVQEHPDNVVGSGVATLFIKKTTDTEWTEKLVYPDGWTREDFNAPEAEEPWTVNLSFGIGGDVEVPNIDDLAKVIGITVEDIKKIISGDSITINGVSAEDIVDYIDKQDDNHVDEALDHVHKDLGFFTGHDDTHASTAFGGYKDVKSYIDAQIAAVTTEYKAYVKNVNTSIANLIYGASVNADGTISIPTGTKIPVGNINVISGSDGFTDGYIRTSAAVEDNDIRAV